MKSVPVLYYIYKLLLYLSLILFSCKFGESFPRAKAGILDLQNWDFKTNPILQLEGEWEFYWNEFCFSNKGNLNPVCNPEKKTSFINMPKLWNSLSYINSNPPISGIGYATHRLFIQTNTEEVLALRLQNVYTAYKLWVNGVLLVEVGHVSTSSTHGKPRLFPVIVDLPSAKNGIEIILQISNFYHKKGGAWRKIYLGPKEKILLEKELDTGIDLFISGCLCFVGFYHIIYFYYRKKDRATFYFGAFSLVIALRILLVEEPFLYRVIPNFPYNLGMKLEFLTSFLPAPLFVLFISEFLYFTGLQKNNRIDYSITFPQFIFSAFIMFIPPSIFTHTLPILYIFIIISILYVIVKLSIAIKEKTIGAYFISFTFIILLIFSINDVLYTETIINTGYYISYGFLF